MPHAPIALFVYNRPDHTRRAVDSIRRNALAADSELHVFSDGPRSQQAAARVDAVRDYIRRIEGFAKVIVYEKECNQGLAKSIIDGVSRLCEQYGRLIVVEDDLLLAPQFLAYMNFALERYRSDTDVMQISGHMFPADVKVDEDAFFLPFTTSWGWATWARAWNQFDPDARDYATLKEDKSRRHSFDMDGAYDYFSMLEAQLAGRVDSWAIRWYLSVFMNHGMVLYPRKSLVENTGFDGSGTHTHGKALDQLIDPDFVPMRLPPPEVNLEVRDQVFAYFRSRRKPMTRLREVVARFFG